VSKSTRRACSIAVVVRKIIRRRSASGKDARTTYLRTNCIYFLALPALACAVLFIPAGHAHATDCPTSADEISTDRPDFTSPPTVVPTGSVQLENGVTWSAEHRSNVVEGPQTLLRVGIAHCAELFFSVPSYVYAIGGSAPTGFSDFVASAKLQLPKFIGFDAAAIAGMSFPTGGSQISSHGYDPELQLPWRHAIGDDWAVDGMFGITWFTTEPHDNPSFESTFELERDLGRSATIFAEYAANYPHHARPTDIFDGAALWRVTPRQQLDLHAGFGINRPMPDHFFAIGHSFRLDGLFEGPRIPF
jgi:hypothetical protein